jgi:hypothetical protein
MIDDIIVTMEDVRKAGMCSSGARAFFKRHDLNWNKFLEQGITAKELFPTQDAMALKVIEVARGRI